jgi:pimeloyl-ACP methyl ester carboxylesterase
VHATVPAEFAEANGIRFAYRRFGAKSGVPLVFFQHFMGNLDDHDPALTDAFAAGLETADLFAHSMGGLVAQEVALDRPGLVRRLVLVGTAPRGGQSLWGSIIGSGLDGLPVGIIAE